MEEDFMTRILDSGKAAMMKTYDGAKKMQPNRPGDKIRTEKEQATIYKRIVNLPHEDRNAIMTEMAKKAGHKGPDLDGCEVCRMVTKWAKQNGDA